MWNDVGDNKSNKILTLFTVLRVFLSIKLLTRIMFSLGFGVKLSDGQSRLILSAGLPNWLNFYLNLEAGLFLRISLRNFWSSPLWSRTFFEKSSLTKMFDPRSCKETIDIILKTLILNYTVSVRHFDKLNLVKLGYGGLVIGSSQFSLLPQLPRKIQLAQKWSKVTQIKSSCFIILNPRNTACVNF